MKARRSSLIPGLMTLLALVVIVESGVLAWVLLVSPEREQAMADLRARPVETIIKICTPSVG